jgi:hypothetical protein
MLSQLKRLIVSGSALAISTETRGRRSDMRAFRSGATIHATIHKQAQTAIAGKRPPLADKIAMTPCYGGRRLGWPADRPARCRQPMSFKKPE